MAFDFQVTIDSAAPHELADWWAEALGWQVEQQDEAFIRRMVRVGRGVGGGHDAAPRRAGLEGRRGADLPRPGPAAGAVPAVPEAKTVKNRVHLDVRVGPDRREAEVARLLGAGATELWRGAQGPVRVGHARRPGGQRVLRELSVSWPRRSRASLRSATARSAMSRARSRRGLRSLPK